MFWILFFRMIALASLYGGQAVTQGVMMRGASSFAVSIQTTKGIETKVFPYSTARLRYSFLNWPFIRGIVAFVEALHIGYTSLIHASTVVSQDDEDETPLSWTVLAGMVVVSLALGLFLFKFVPLWLTALADSSLHFPSWLFNLIDGILTLLIFVFYLYIIGRSKDIQEVFRYHGGEHKVINCLENNKSLSIKNILSQSQVHLRCGTTFLFVVFFISIFLYVFIPKDLPFFVNLGLRIGLLPLIASISFELQQFIARIQHPLFTWILLPGLALQSLTVLTPQPKHARVAKAALQAVIDSEKNEQT